MIPGIVAQLLKEEERDKGKMKGREWVEGEERREGEEGKEENRNVRVPCEGATSLYVPVMISDVVAVQFLKKQGRDKGGTRRKGEEREGRAVKRRETYPSPVRAQQA